MVIADQMMPGMNGAEFVQKLKEAGPRVPVILATGFGEIPAALDSMALRLAKPFDEDQLADAIRAVCRHRRSRALCAVDLLICVCP